MKNYILLKITWIPLSFILTEAISGYITVLAYGHYTGQDFFANTFLILLFPVFFSGLILLKLLTTYLKRGEVYDKS
jgi:hypothetical protein